MTDRHARLTEVFLAALDLPNEERETYLTEACRNDPEMRADVEKLLEVDRRRAILDTPALGAATADVIERAAAVSEPVPSQIGPYTVLEAIGRGGMGTVYKARQSQPERLVALKLIRPDLMSDSMAQRFRYEGEVLGRLQHPGIAQIFEAGETTQGNGRQPFLAMELIDGRPLLEYARSLELSVHARMDLLSRLCAAVHHAHQHGVIHRDLKPSNILVTADGQPKILDFGVARATDSEARLTSLHTGAGQLVGTPPYMSPEQIVGDARNIDARSDIYALGVVGYELLAGRPPYELEGKPLAEVARIIQNTEPSWPALPGKEYHGDVRVIIYKALDKDKTRRYQSAAAMADDIVRYLHDQPILARPASVIYQFRKFARRNKALVGGCALALVFLLLGIAGTSFGLIRARVEAHRSRTVNEFFTGVLSSADPFSDKGGPSVTLLEILHRAAGRISGAFPDQPHIEADIRLTLGKTYGSLGYYDEASEQLNAALSLSRSYHGEQHEAVAECLRALATNTVHRTADYNEAERLLDEALAISTRRLGLAHPKSVEIIRDLAWTLKEAKLYDRAVERYNEALRIQRDIAGDENEMIAGILNDLGGIARVQGKLDEAEALYAESIELFRRLVDETHPYIGIVEGNLAVVLSAKGDHNGAEKRYRAAIEALSRAIGENHPRVGRVVNNLASLLHEQNKLDEADIEYRRALAIFRVSVGEDHADFASTLNNYAMLLWSLGKYEECASAYRRFGDYLAREHGADYWHVHLTNFYLGETVARLGRIQEAERLLVDAQAALSSQFAPDDPRVQYSTKKLIAFLNEHGKSELAARYDDPAGAAEKDEPHNTTTEDSTPRSSESDH